MRMDKALNIIFIVTLSWLVYRQASLYLRHQSVEGQTAPRFTVPTLQNGEFDSAAAGRPLVLVFWATWCGPCRGELARINHLIENKEISPESVLAISSAEERAVVERAATERKYLFPIGLDASGEVARSFAVSATPTVIFIEKSGTIQWMTTGMSPLLGMRITKFLKE